MLGFKFFPLKWKSANEKLQLICTALLIFSMGVKLGSRENILSELSSLGLRSLLYALIPIVCSVIVVYWLTSRFMKPKHHTKEKEVK